MLANLIMTIIGPDRPGLVGSLASVIASQGGNWLESRMGHLEGQFAGILRVQVPEESVDSLLNALRGLESEKLEVIAHRGESIEASASLLRSFSLEVIGHDRPGIVREITGTLARFRINVEELETERSSAPMTGGMLFQARARIVLPADCPESLVRSELEKIASDLMVELRLGENAG
ncbi:MAG: ACT domain-containing protein [Opitutaceae bacterium]